MNTGEPDATEIGHVRFGKGPSKKDQPHIGTSSAAYFTARWVRREAARKRPEFTTREHGPRRAAHPVHVDVSTTQIYLHADLAVKQRALDRTAPPETSPGRYRPPDALLTFLNSL
jgi:hypothetical protein